ncbi:MarR family transcriptional regulator [Actinomycetospora endophytica]|uniref:MarR family transcriptional regulator n=1 Tax=Actinomycetospora endophytica TaxID=2291215 RepID=A0ABS8PHX1_9PSEU|nr:helix-turn-helix domain-containing protein [Actinomycetospora endophytica]MCD2197845.1 MarR family transcriptional regulator [Actinomycetospora endophytica]
MPDISVVPTSPWGAERDPVNAEIADHILQRLLTAATALHRGNADELGLDPSMLAIVDVLGVVPELTVAALADRVALSHAATSRAVTRLEERDWVERLDEPGTPRFVMRAAETTTVVDASRQDVRSPLAAAADALDPQAREAVLLFLTRVTDILTTRARSRGDRRLLRTLERRRKEWDKERRGRRADTP